jgi:hypothetical protein
LEVEVWKEEKYGLGSRRGSKPRMTVLARTSNNLLDWTVIRDGKALNIIDLRRI